MTFDPFGDFDSRGYLRNRAGLKDPKALAEFQHRIFLKQLPAAAAYLSQQRAITYEAMLKTHALLFGRVYPWAGQDRQTTAPGKQISKGPVTFAPPLSARKAAEHGLGLARGKGGMAARPGEIIGYLAYAHPFLDGNGRTILTIASELAARDGFSIGWSRMSKQEYLQALTAEIDKPGKGALDQYLGPFRGPLESRDERTASIGSVRGLSGSHHDEGREAED